MKRFLQNIGIFFLPIVLLVGYYIIDDPFMMYWKYDNLYDSNARKICANDAYRGLRWMNQFNDSLHYNSFVTGSSRSDFYYVEDWKQYLDSDASCFHFNQSGDNLLGTVERVRYLYKHFDRIDNILFIMDYEYLADVTPKKGHLFRQPWQVTPQWDFFAYNLECLRAFFSVEYQKEVLGISDKEQKLPYYYIPEYNEVHKIGAEQLLDTDPDSYYATITSSYYQLYERTGQDSIAPIAIEKKQIELLTELKSLLTNGNTDYRIVISPLYNQIQINPMDIENLQTIFGEDRVFDFSGVNSYTNDPLNYYEVSHYRPRLCKKILEYIYLN